MIIICLFVVIAALSPRVVFTVYSCRHAGCVECQIVIKNKQKCRRKDQTSFYHNCGGDGSCMCVYLTAFTLDVTHKHIIDHWGKWFEPVSHVSRQCYTSSLPALLCISFIYLSFPTSNRVVCSDRQKNRLDEDVKSGKVSGWMCAHEGREVRPVARKVTRRRLSMSRAFPTMIPRAVCLIQEEWGGKGMGILC